LLKVPNNALLSGKWHFFHDIGKVGSAIKAIIEAPKQLFFNDSL